MAGNTVSVVITGDASGLDRALGQADRSLGDFGKKATGKTKTFTDNLTNMIGTPQMIAAGAAAAAGAKVLQFAKQSVLAAADAESAMLSLQTVFGDSADKVKKFGETSAKSYGLSRREAAQVVAPIGQLLRGLGFTERQAADAALQVSKLGADLAAAFPQSGGPANAVAALGAALRGEYDPAERFGIGLSETTVKAKMLEMGFKTLTGEINLNERAQAVLALMMERTSKVQGEFARKSDTAAVKMQILRAEFDDLKVTFGEGMLAELESSADGALQLTDGLKELAGPAGKAAGIQLGMLSEIVEFFGNYVHAAGDLWNGFMEKLNRPMPNGGQSIMDDLRFLTGTKPGQDSVLGSFFKFSAINLPLGPMAAGLKGVNDAYADLNQTTKEAPEMVMPEMDPAAVEILTTYNSQVNAGTVSVKKYADAMEAAAASVIRLADAQREETRGFIDVRKKADEVTEALEAVTEAEAEFGTGSREHKAALDELTLAQMDFEESVYAIAEARTELAAKEAEARGQKMTDLELYAEEVRQLKKLKDETSDPAVIAAIDARIAKLEEERVKLQEVKLMWQNYGQVMRDNVLDPSAVDALIAAGYSMPEIQAQFMRGYVPGRADGGPVVQNRPYVVGEEGPELFVPGQNGTIMPNGTKMGVAAGGGGITVNVGHYYGPPDQFVSDMAEALRRLEAARR